MRRSLFGLASVSILALFVLTESALPAQAAPVIQTYTPHGAPIGGVVLITGTGFGATQGSSTVKFNGTLATSVTQWSATQITVTVPSGASTGNLVVNVGGVNSAGQSFTVTPAPTISSVSPGSAAIGASITMGGSNLTAGGNVTPKVYFFPTGTCSICGYGANPTSSTNTSVAIVVPAGATTGNVVVNVDGVDSNALTFTLTGTRAPIADVGPGHYRTVPVGNATQFDGTASYDLGGLALTYHWAVTAAPAGSTAAVQNSTTPFPTFTPDLTGSYTIQLTVNNGQQNSPPSSVFINTQNSPPVANGGPNQTVRLNSTVHLDGSASTDPDGDPLTYKWRFYSKPSGSTATLSSSTVVNPTFVTDKPGK